MSELKKKKRFGLPLHKKKKITVLYLPRVKQKIDNFNSTIVIRADGQAAVNKIAEDLTLFFFLSSDSEQLQTEHFDHTSSCRVNGVTIKG